MYSTVVKYVNSIRTLDHVFDGLLNRLVVPGF
jgi:hypothetical protein